MATAGVIAFGWEGPVTIIGGLLVTGLTVLLILHEPRNSRVRVGLFLERHVNKNGGGGEMGDEELTPSEESEDEQPTAPEEDEEEEGGGEEPTEPE